jgi:DNA invertase Pin-like site-specific DNA recombinase
MIYGYTRVSTAEQANGTSLSEQDMKVRGVAMVHGTTPDKIFVDAVVSWRNGPRVEN